MNQPFVPKDPTTRRFFDAAEEALSYARQIDETNKRFIREKLSDFLSGRTIEQKVRANYPYIRVTIDRVGRGGAKKAYGFVENPGSYSTTVTRVQEFGDYFLENLQELGRHHRFKIEVGVSEEPIPLHFAFAEDMAIGHTPSTTPEMLQDIPEHFFTVDVENIDPNAAFTSRRGAFADDRPLAYFNASRIDFSCHRIFHYTATKAADFQRYILFTNYDFIDDEFRKQALALCAPTDDAEALAYGRQYTSFTQSGGLTHFNQNLEAKGPIGGLPARRPQSPAYHLKRQDRKGISLVNIGVGPSHAKTMTDLLAVLRPDAWMMLGHCAGLRGTQKIGDYVMPSAFVRDDRTLDDALPPEIPVPAMLEPNRATQTAIRQIAGGDEKSIKDFTRNGAIYTTNNRNWEIEYKRQGSLYQRMRISKAIALDMETSVIAGNGFYYGVPYSSLLCVSDRPLHGEIKLPGMANSFYEQQKKQHVRIGVRAMEIMRDEYGERLHSRQLRPFDAPPFR